MKSKLFTASLLASALLAGLGSASVMAQGTNTPGIDQAKQTISTRIQQGIASGHLTPAEVRELSRRSRDIDIRESRFKSDGSATGQERQQLRDELEDLGAEVERLMTNPDVVTQPSNTPGIDNSQIDISERIEEGVRTGRITEREARRLQRRERDIARMETRFKRDGVVTQQERRQLRDQVRRLRDDVERMMRDERRDRR